MRDSQIFGDSFLKLVLNIFILPNLILGWGRWLLRRSLVFCIKSKDLGELLIVGGVGFIRKVVIIQDPLKRVRGNFLQKLFSAITR